MSHMGLQRTGPNRLDTQRDGPPELLGRMGLKRGQLEVTYRQDELPDGKHLQWLWCSPSLSGGIT